MNASATKQRLFIYRLQSSGASLFAYFLAQQPDTTAILDLLVPHVAPPLQVEKAVIVKATVCTTVDLTAYLVSFQPDCALLYLRHPRDNYRSLDRKPYRDDGGPIEAKFTQLEQVFRQRDRWFNATICYETFLSAPEQTAARLRQLGIQIPPDAAAFKRPLADIIRLNQQWRWWCRQYFGQKWHLGNINARNLKPLAPVYYPDNGASEGQKRPQLCPTLTAFYEEVYEASRFIHHAS